MPATSSGPNNFLGTLSPDVLALDTLDFLKKKFPILTAIATDFSDEPVRLNTQIITRVVTPPPVQSYTQAAGYAPSSGVATDVAVTINNFRYAAISFYDDELAMTPRNLVAEQVEAAAYALGKDAADKLLALASIANFTHSVTTSANFTRSTLTAARAALRKAGANPSFFGVLNSDAWQYLTSDQTMINTFMLNVNNANVNFEDGHIQGISGFKDVYEYSDLNIVNTTVNGFFASKNALIMAARVPSDPAAFVADIPVNAIIKNVMDEDTGITLQYRYHYDVQRGRLNMILTWIFGVALGVAGHGTLVTAS
jgi:hypothetical protein